MGRLTERDWKNKCAGYMWNVHPIKDIDDLPYYKKLAEYEDLEEQGLLLKLPCKVGDIVYVIVEEFEEMYDSNSNYYCIYEEKFHPYMLEDIGKYVFLTKEEAEEALRKKVD